MILKGSLLNCLKQPSLRFITRKKTYFISSPIFYVNASPHVGHLYTVLLADAQKRFQQLQGHETFFSTGTDEHGLKIQQAADKMKKSPPEFCDEISAKFRMMFDAFGIEYSDFVRTSEDRHSKAVEAIWQKLESGGHIYKDVYESWYSIQDESFLTELQTEVRPDGVRVSLESGHPVEWATEENFVFKLNPFKEKISEWLQDNQVIQPSIFQNHLLALLSKEELPDVSVSRSQNRLQWGIPVPGDSSQTVYVWLDALTNYLTVTGFPDRLDNHHLWPVDCHVIGKDILKFHAVYWPAFLMAADLELPKRILCHSHWMVDDLKMSKSRGNVLDPLQLIEKFSADGLRYFLLREGTPHSDANFSIKKMTNYLNSELCNTLGNLLNRTTSKSVNVDQLFFAFDSQLFEEYMTEECHQLMSSLEELPFKVSKHYEDFNYYLGVDLIMECLRITNAFVQTEQPWVLKKTNVDRLKVVVHIALEAIRVCGILLQPIVPNLSKNLLDKLNISIEERAWSNASALSWKSTNRSCTSLSDKNVVLFKRLK